MREAAFIQRNEAKWARLEQVLGRTIADLHADEASALYIELNDDLSYARTFYPDSKVTVYLNGLAVRLHQHIYRNERTPRKRFLSFWTQEVPLAMAATRKQLLLSFGIFVVTFLIGAISAEHDPTFVRLIMGDGYVDMTLENIHSGDPLAVYGKAGRTEMFLGITINNIYVAMLCFVLGILAGVGTVFKLMQTGIMVGSFQYFFHQHGVLRESLLTIWVHGTLEISAIIIASSAGLTMGLSWFFPGTYTRGESLRRGAKLGLKVAMGLFPIFIIAGFLESFVTRHALTMPWYVSVLIIGLSLVFVIYYFIILPYHAERRARQPSPSA